jgi:hypothetical protein
MPDLPGFLEAIASLLRPGGAAFIYEQHPILEMLVPGGPDDPVKWELSYFDKTPIVDTDGLDYYGGESYDAKPTTSFIHTVSEIITAGIRSGMAVEHFEELPGHISCIWLNVEKQGPRLPLSFTLVLRMAD